VDALGKAMGFSTSLDMQAREFEVRDAGPFTGVYGGQLALPLEPDRLSYLVNETIEGLRVSYLDPANGTFTPGPLYDLDAAQGRDPYDLFLRGAQPLIRIENPHASNPAELYLFRDSFGSSLAPLLAQGYSRITLIDLRYIDYRMVRDLIDFAPGSDVLFCYGSQIFNNSSVLLTP
jgi:hypothetical protein